MTEALTTPLRARRPEATADNLCGVLGSSRLVSHEWLFCTLPARHSLDLKSKLEAETWSTGPLPSHTFSLICCPTSPWCACYVFRDTPPVEGGAQGNTISPRRRAP